MRCVHLAEHNRVAFWCPGCKDRHFIDPARWTWNQSTDAPTISSSILVRWTFGDTHEPRVCHSFVCDGHIQFLDDCTHALKGQTVDLPEVDAEGYGNVPPHSASAGEARG